MESSSISGSSKRAKAHANIAHCLVDGCNADLSLCREYHRRHKVCEVHSKTPKVHIGGREQRFCQQCSRFHSLAEFDEGKRSCRKRLDGHNRRRRKPQPDTLARNSPLRRGAGLLSFSTPQILPSAVVGFSWAGGVVKPDHDFNNQQQQQQQLNYVETPNSFPIFSDGLNPVVDSDGALSLLSSGSLGADPQQHGPGLVQYGGLGQHYGLGQESKEVGSSTESHSGSTLHFPEMFQSSTSGSHQTLSFMWE